MPCLFEGYFVAVTADARALAKRLAQLAFPAHMAGAVGDGFAPMDEDAERFIAAAMDQMCVIHTSNGIITNGELHVYQGPLAGHESRVLGIDREQGIARVRLGADTKGSFTLSLPLEVSVEIGREPNGNGFGKECSAETGPAFLLYDQNVHKKGPWWYLAACPRNEEDATWAAIKRDVRKSYLEDAFVPRIERERKIRGEWKRDVIAMFPGYLVVVTGDAVKLNRKLSRCGIAARLVGGSSAYPAALDRGVQEAIEDVMDEDHLVKLSLGEIVNDELHVLEGPLMGYESRIASWNRRKCFANVRVREGDDEHVLALPIAIPVRRTDDDGAVAQRRQLR